MRGRIRRLHTHYMSTSPELREDKISGTLVVELVRENLRWNGQLPEYRTGLQ